MQTTLVIIKSMLKINGGRNAILYVEPIKFDDTYILEEDTGTPVYFKEYFE